MGIDVTKEAASILRDALTLIERAQFSLPGAQIDAVGERIKQITALADGLSEGNFTMRTTDTPYVEPEESNGS